MPLAGETRISVVVEEDARRTPEQNHGVRRGDHHADDGGQTLRPGGAGAERSLRPIVIAYEPRHFARSVQQAFGCGRLNHKIPRDRDVIGRLLMSSAGWLLAVAGREDEGSADFSQRLSNGNCSGRRG